MEADLSLQHKITVQGKTHLKLMKYFTFAIVGIFRWIIKHEDYYKCFVCLFAKEVQVCAILREKCFQKLQL